MNKKNLILGIFLIALMMSSCVKDLNVKPIDPSLITTGNLTASDYPGVLAKIYASFIVNGQAGNSSLPDISASDNDFFTTGRAMWNLQELPTDEAICAWGDAGIADLNTQTWSANNPFLTAVYQRLGLTITYANSFIGLTKGSSDPNVMRYNAEARFLRALAYYYAIDLFGQFAFTTEADGVGKFFPKIADRKTLFTYVESELLDIQTKLGAPGFSYPNADQACAWTLLARLYLNAQVYTGTAHWADCITYCQKVVSSGKYALAANYRKNFSADNDARTNSEMIFSWAQDGISTQGFVGTTFLIESCADGTYINAPNLGLTVNTNWNGNRTKKQFINVLVDTLATYGNVPVPASDTVFAQCPDKRVFCKQRKSWEIPSPSASGMYGIGVRKFQAFNSDGKTLPSTWNATFSCTDMPVFRYSEVLLMLAEAQYNVGGASIADAVTNINLVRARAGISQINAAWVTPTNLSNELGREFYYEGHRRTDLIRFGLFTGSTYTWAWKGGSFNGVATDAHFNVYPIPAAELVANPNYGGKNNPGY